MLYQVVGATFGLMEEYARTWKRVGTSEEVPVFGFQYEVGLEPVKVNIQRMIDKFTLGAQELAVVWEKVLPGGTLDFLRRLAGTSGDGFHMPDSLWVDIIYSFALAAHQNILNKEHLLKSVTPLYIGRTASFVIEAWESSGPEVEEKIENLCREYEKNKPSFSDRWG